MPRPTAETLVPLDVDSDLRYDSRTALLHWSTAALVVLLWLMGRLTSYLPKGPFRLDVWSIHVLLGFVLAALIVARITWRLTGGIRLPPAYGGVRGTVARVVHFTLYAMLLVIAASGIANVLGHGFALFGVWKFPRFGDDSVKHMINEWHDLAANIIIAIALFHACAALANWRIHPAGILGRMRPAR